MLCIFTEPLLKTLDVSHLRFMGPFMLIRSLLWSTSRMAFGVNCSLNHFYTNCSIEFNVIYTENLLRLVFSEGGPFNFMFFLWATSERIFLCKGCIVIVLIDIMHCFCFRCDWFYLPKRRFKRRYTTFQTFQNCIFLKQ